MMPRRRVPVNAGRPVLTRFGHRINFAVQSICHGKVKLQRRRATGCVGWIWVLYDWCAAAATATIISLVISRGPGVSTQITSLLNGLQVGAGMLLLFVRATTTFANERAGGGMDVLLSTPLERRGIVFAKWWGRSGRCRG